jgi:hypothetical protein
MKTKTPSPELLKAIAEASEAYAEKLRAAERTPEAKYHEKLKERVRVLHAEHIALNS